MNTALSTDKGAWRKWLSILAALGLVALALPIPRAVQAQSSSPFVGHWWATDPGDGSDIRLAIGGGAGGPFQITWTEDYLSFCNGEAGIVRGTGSLDPTDSNLLSAELRVDCFSTGASLDFAWEWRYHPATDTLSSQDGSGTVIIWRHPGNAGTQPPDLDLRVNYGADDWVESFYEAGHTAWVSVTDANGALVATTELTTEPKSIWDGGTGFTSLDGVWFDPDGNPMEYAPDIQREYWVFGWIDNGASAQVQIGTITGTVDLANDSITGTVYAPWFTGEVSVECLDWGSGPDPYENKDGGSILPDGIDPYSCSWAGEWDIQPDQAVGVAYTGLDGNWVANSFVAQLPYFVAYVPGAVEGYQWPMGNWVDLDINGGEYTASRQSEQRPEFPTGETRVLFELGGAYSLKAGDQVTMTDGTTTKVTVVTDLAVTAIDVAAGTVSGIFDPSYDLRVWLYDIQDDPALVTSGGTWTATFDELPPGALGGATQDEIDQDGDGTSIDFQVPAAP
jgi:hypothetical protein